MAWRLAKSLITLRQQIDGAFPGRSKKSDGSVGDLRHQKSRSDHNPNSQGVVQAIDITHSPDKGFDAGKFAEHLRVTRDPRIKYVISNARIFSSTTAPWQWRAYHGKNPHRAHCHISVSDNPKHYDNQSLWQIRPVRTAQGFMSSPEPELSSDSGPEPTEAGDPADRCYWDQVSDKGEELSEGDDAERAGNLDQIENEIRAEERDRKPEG
jgi:hypothetical protein